MIQYQKNLYQKEERRIPTLLVIPLLAVFVFAANFFVTRPSVSKIEATPVNVEKFEFTNETNNSISIFWRTPTESIGWIVYGNAADQTTSLAFDMRDMENDPKKYKNHFVSISGLSDNTKYYFYLVVDKKIVKNSLIAPSFTTKSKVSVRANSSPALGKSVGKNSLALDNGIVFMKIDGVSIWAALTKSSGEWLIPTYFLTKLNSNELFIPAPDTNFKFEILDESGDVAVYNTNYKSISPISQTIKIGENYNIVNPEIKVLGEATQSATLIMDTKVATPSAQKTDFEINFPANNVLIDGSKPLFKGVAPEKQKLAVMINKIEKKPIPAIAKYSFFSDLAGKWSYSPLESLTPGKHEFIISYTDTKKKEISRSLSFTVGKSGEAVLGSATPEAVISPSISPSPTLKPYQKPSPTPIVAGGDMVPMAIGAVAVTIIGVGLILIF